MIRRIAVLGAGEWAQAHHLPALAAHPDVALARIVDIDGERAAQAAARFGAASWSTSPDMSDVDAVVIATPHATHAELTTAYLERGIAVLVEKPLATRVDDAFALVATAERTGVPLLVGYTAQFSNAAARVREWFHEGLIGELLHVAIEFSSRAGRLYRAHAEDSRSAYSAENGGQAATQLSHAVAAALSSLGQEATRVAGIVANRGTAVDVDDAFVFALGGGAMGAGTSTGALADGAAVRQVVRYIGDQGSISHDLLWGRATLSTEGGMRCAAPSHHEAPYPAAGPVSTLVSILGGGPNPSPVRPAAATVAFIDALQTAARTGRLESVRPLPAPMSRDKGDH
ncbi:hypothetical protein GCM10027064_24610 [Microbacterium petrolearium]|jgi:predicted dehydrogenase